MPLQRGAARCSAGCAAADPWRRAPRPDRHGYVSLGTNADYVAPFIGQVPFFLEANAAMPRTSGRNSIHLSQSPGWCEADRPLVEVPPAVPDEVDQRIAAQVAERIPNGACLQAGIGSIPNGVLAALHGHRDLGVHTELLSDGVIDLVEQGVITGVHKTRPPTKVVATFCPGHAPALRLPRRQPGRGVPTGRLGERPAGHRPGAQLRVDQRHRRGRLPRPGGVGDDRRSLLVRLGRSGRLRPRCHVLPGGQGFLVLPSTVHGGNVSRIVPAACEGSVVTTLKNTTDKVVTEHGVAEMRGRTVARAHPAMISIADPPSATTSSAKPQAMGWW